jgi:prolyl-tRNA synthetase
MSNAFEIAKEYFPDACEDEISFILWNKTGFPHFFKEGEKSLREQLAKYKEARGLGKDVCMYCSQIADSDMHPECMEKFREITRKQNQ